MEKEESLQFSTNLLRGDAAGHHNGVAHPRILVEDEHQLNGSVILKAVEYKVIAPDMVLVCRPKTHAGPYYDIYAAAYAPDGRLRAKADIHVSGLPDSPHDVIWP